MTRRDWLLLLIAHDASERGLEPVRVQKALFLLAQEGDIPPEEQYQFVAYNYGPMSVRVYRDVSALVHAGLAEHVPVPGYTWQPVRATAAGRRQAAALLAEASPADHLAIARLHAIHHLVTALGFAELLEAIYRRYPEFASRSVFRRRRR